MKYMVEWRRDYTEWKKHASYEYLYDALGAAKVFGDKRAPRPVQTRVIKIIWESTNE